MENEPPAARRPGELRSARTGLILFCANFLFAVALGGSYLLPTFASTHRRQSVLPGATPTTATFDFGALPGSSPTSAPIQAQATATAITHSAAPTATRALPTATSILQPTVAVTPTPSPTVSNGGG